MIYHMLKDRTKLVRKRFLYRTFLGLEYALHRAPKDPVFILATRRSGSNLLLGALNSVPGISLGHEILHKKMVYGLRERFISKRAALRHIRHSVNHGAGSVRGAKLLMHQLEKHRIGTADLVRLFPSCRFIVLYRKSLLDQFISLKVAEATDRWQWTGNDIFIPPASVRVEPAELERYCTKIKSFYSRLLADPLVRERSVVISYEELCADIQYSFNTKLFPFLGMHASRVCVVTRKQNGRAREEMVENYGEISPFVSGKEPVVFQEYAGVKAA